MTPTGAFETSPYARDLDSAEQFYGESLELERVVREGAHQSRHPRKVGFSRERSTIP